MKRDEFKGKVNNLSSHLCYPVLNDLHDIDDHDAEQRTEIERLQARVAKWESVEALDMRIFDLSDKELTAEFYHNAANIARQMEERWKEANIEIATLREALQGILEIGKRDMTNPKYDGYFEQAQQALKELT